MNNLELVKQYIKTMIKNVANEWILDYSVNFLYWYYSW